jgi:hypothetical protein
MPTVVNSPCDLYVHLHIDAIALGRDRLTLPKGWILSLGQMKMSADDVPYLSPDRPCSVLVVFAIHPICNLVPPKWNHTQKQVIYN